MEIWMPIEEFPAYEVSSEGRVKNLKTGRILKPQKNNKGYAQVFLRQDNKQYTKKIHRLVADTFYEGRHSNLDVNHIDGNKCNNHISNLELCTRKENVQHAFRTGLKHPSRTIKVRVIETGKVYDSIRECSRHTGCNQSDICKCLNGEYKTSKGYHFEKV